MLRGVERRPVAGLRITHQLENDQDRPVIGCNLVVDHLRVDRAPAASRPGEDVVDTPLKAARIGRFPIDEHVGPLLPENLHHLCVHAAIHVPGEDARPGSSAGQQFVEEAGLCHTVPQIGRASCRERV